MSLQFRYFAAGLFRDLSSSKTEFRVIAIPESTPRSAASVAEGMMLRYASDFGLSYCGALNVFEAGSDMSEEYGELFSMTWESNPVFDRQLFKVISDAPDSDRSKGIGDGSEKLPGESE